MSRNFLDVVVENEDGTKRPLVVASKNYSTNMTVNSFSDYIKENDELKEEVKSLREELEILKSYVKLLGLSI